MQSSEAFYRRLKNQQEPLIPRVPHLMEQIDSAQRPPNQLPNIENVSIESTGDKVVLKREYIFNYTALI